MTTWNNIQAFIKKISGIFLNADEIQLRLDQNRINTCLKQVVIGDSSFFFSEAKVANLQFKKEHIQIGSNSNIRGELLIYPHGGGINVGDYCYIGENSKIWSSNLISIGNRVLISHNVNIHDNDAHPFSYTKRHEHYKTIITSGHPRSSHFKDAPVIIEDDVWIGFNVTILKGVTIGRGVIIGANSVITKNIPEFSLVVGNPQRIVKKLND